MICARNGGAGSGVGSAQEVYYDRVPHRSRGVGRRIRVDAGVRAAAAALRGCGAPAGRAAGGGCGGRGGGVAIRRAAHHHGRHGGGTRRRRGGRRGERPPGAATRLDQTTFSSCAAAVTSGLPATVRSARTASRQNVFPDPRSTSSSAVHLGKAGRTGVAICSVSNASATARTFTVDGTGSASSSQSSPTVA